MKLPLGRSYCWVLMATALTAFALPLHADLVTHLRFDDGEGFVAKNSAAPSTPGKLSAIGSTWTQKVPKAFVPRSAYHNSGEDGAYVIAEEDPEGRRVFEDFTVTGWVRVTKANGQIGGFDRIFSKRDKQGDQAIDIGVIDVGERGMGIGVMVGSPERFVTRLIDFSEAWVFFAVTRTCDSGEILIYLGSADLNAFVELSRKGIGGSGPMKNRAPVMIGNTPLGTHRAGEVSYSDFRVYDEVLEAEQIEEIRRENLAFD